MTGVLRLALVTHAATEATRAARFPDDESLSPAGHRDLAKAASMSAERIVVAPERRTRETATGLGLDGTVDQSVRDVDYARWRGLTMESRQPGELAQWLTDPASAPHGGESIVELIDRTRNWLAALEPETASVLAVTHPAVVRAAIVVTLGAPPEAFWRIDVPPLSVTRLHWRGRWTLRQTGWDYPKSTP